MTHQKNANNVKNCKDTSFCTWDCDLKKCEQYYNDTSRYIECRTAYAKCLDECGPDKETCKSNCVADAQQYFLTQSELEKFINSTTPLEPSYNQSAKLYKGKIYISFKDFRMWTASKDNEGFYKDSHTDTFIFPIGGVGSGTWSLPDESEKDHLVISYVLRGNKWEYFQ